MTTGDATSIEPVLGACTIIADGAVVGRACRIGAHVLVEAGARIGDRVTLHSGVQVFDGVTLGDDVFVGPNATFVTDRFPRSGQPPSTPARTMVRSRASIGANATLLPGVQIGEDAMVGAGAVVTRDVPRDAIVVGNPARIVGYIEKTRSSVLRPVRLTSDVAPRQQVLTTDIKGVTLHALPVMRDLRGSLVAGEVGGALPFVPQRYFMVFDVPAPDVRGEHAHRRCHQFLICVHGEIHVVADDGEHRQEFVLDHQSRALYLPPMTWGVQYRYSPSSTLLVLASHPYEPDDYIRDYAAFRAELSRTPMNP